MYMVTSVDAISEIAHHEYADLSDARKCAELLAVEGHTDVTVWMRFASVETQMQSVWSEHVKGFPSV